MPTDIFTQEGLTKRNFWTTAGAHVPLRLHIKPARLENGWRMQRPFLTSGVSVLARGSPASGQPTWCFDLLHLPYSVIQRSSSSHSFSAWVLPLKLRGETQNLRYLFYVFQTETTNSTTTSSSSRSTQLVYTSTSAIVISDTMILLYDTLYVAKCNLVYLRG